jgi:hypothetical protein
LDPEKLRHQAGIGLIHRDHPGTGWIVGAAEMDRRARSFYAQALLDELLSKQSRLGSICLAGGNYQAVAPPALAWLMVSRAAW